MLGKLWDNLSSIVYSTAPHIAEYLLSLSDNAFIEKINNAFRSPFESTKPTTQFDVMKTIFQLPPIIFGSSSNELLLYF
jgi:hypothetical protein